MAEMAESEPIPSSSEDPSPLVDVKGDDGPPEKRRKLEKDDSTDKLENRLGGILCCAVCLDLPQAAVYQCSNGHLMCAPCFSHLLADARLRDESATCPNCRVEISKTSASRNLAVEKTVSELPSDCKFCARVFPRHSLQNHEEKTCEERLMGCQYSCIGCPWLGPAHEVSAHEAACAHPAKSASEVVGVLGERERRAAEARALHRQLLELLSSEKMTFNDLQLKPYRTEEFLHKLYYETSRFPAFGHQWVVKAFVNKNQRDPTQSSARELTYQLVLKSRSATALGVQWVCLRGPFGEAELCARAELCVFGDDCAEAPARPLPLAHAADANRLLANKAIHFRLVMFQTSN